MASNLHPRRGCPDLDPNWPGFNGTPRGPVLCVLYPNCKCGDEDKRAGRTLHPQARRADGRFPPEESDLGKDGPVR